MPELVLVRHGETVGESAIRLYGSTDVALSELGRRQMDRVRVALDGIAFDRIYTSPLVRSRESAAIVHPRRRPLPTVVPSFSEIDFGAWEGLTREEVAERDPEQFRSWGGTDLSWGFPQGDTREGFQRRVKQSTLELLLEPQGVLLCVLHKGVVKTIIGALLGQSHEIYSRIPCELGSIHRLSCDNGSWHLVSECEVEHLGEARLVASR